MNTTKSLTAKVIYISKSKKAILRKELIAETKEKALLLIDFWNRMGVHSGYSYDIESIKDIEKDNIQTNDSFIDGSNYGYGLYKTNLVEELVLDKINT